MLEVVGVRVCEPCVDFDPPHAPEAVQEVVFAELHVRVVWLPEVMLVGEAESERVGDGGGGVWVGVEPVEPVVPEPFP